MSYGMLRTALFSFLVLYAVVGFLTHVTARSRENFYPFFSWSLFAKVPPRIQEEFEMRIIGIRGERFERPVPLFEARNLLLLSPASVQEAERLVEEFGRALSGNGQETEALRKALESRFDPTLSYEIVKIKFNPIDRLRSGQVLTEESTARFLSNP